MKLTYKKILDKGKASELRALFGFSNEPIEIIRKKFVIWSRWFFPQYFDYPDAPFHEKWDYQNIAVYTGRNPEFLNIAGRGLAKTARIKLFIAFVIANDENHFRKYLKILSEDVSNAKQTVTDAYNILISRRVKSLYPEVFQKTDLKREETMGSFTTATGVKLSSESLRTSQRGDIQEDSRPDWEIFDDFETKSTLRSAVKTLEIWDNMEEARVGLAKGGGVIYNCNYISERGNVHKLFHKIPNKIVVSIEDETKERYTPSWADRDTPDDLKEIERKSDDYNGEYRCRPEISKNVYFDRDSVDKQTPLKPIDIIAGFKIFKRYNPSHRIASGHDVGGGVGLDHSTSVFIDFDQMPAQVLATYKNNEIKPDEFGYEIIRQAKKFGENYIAVEKNFPGNSTLVILKQNYPLSKLHKTRGHKPKIITLNPTELGWATNSATKHTMLNDLASAIEEGVLDLNDPDIIAEVKNYTRDDLMDKEEDPRLTTRHFDLLIACAIAWQLNSFVKKPNVEEPFDPMLERLMSQDKTPNNPAR